MNRANVVYPNDPECSVVTFDVRRPEAVAALHRQHVVLAGYWDVEILVQDPFALVIRLGWASNFAA
jgi:hypothetical protein